MGLDTEMLADYPFNETAPQVSSFRSPRATLQNFQFSSQLSGKSPGEVQHGAFHTAPRQRWQQYRDMLSPRAFAIQ